MSTNIIPDTRVAIPPGGLVLPLPPGTFALGVRSANLGYRLAFGDGSVRAIDADVIAYGSHRHELPREATHVAFAPASPAPLVLDVWVEIGAGSAARWLRAHSPAPQLAIAKP